MLKIKVSHFRRVEFGSYINVVRNQMRHLIATVIFSFLFSTSFGQKEKEKLLQYFDKVDIYVKTQTIKTAYKVKDGKFDGYAADFNEQGEPILIGQYKAGVRVGYWLMPNGHTLSYEKERAGIVVPAEGRDYSNGKNEFESLYAMFVSVQSTKQ